MNNEIMLIGNILGTVLQAIYFSIFLIFTKGLKEKRLLFIILMIIEYFIIQFVCNFNINVNFELIYTIMTYLILKLLYGHRARITDITIFILSLIVLGIISVMTSMTIGMNIVGLLLSNIITIFLTYLLKHKLAYIDMFYDKFWNRHSDKKMLKSITIRGISVILTVITFVLLHFWLLYGILVVRR